MTFQVPDSVPSKDQDKFEFTIPGVAGKFSVRKAKYVPIDELIPLETDGLATLEFFGEAGTKQGDAVRKLHREQFKALVAAWRDDSEVTSGESPASAS